MLDMGFIPDIKRIIALIPAMRQTLLFSATFSDEIRKLASQFQKDPATVEVARRNEPIALVTQYVHMIDANRKRELLSHLVKKNNWEQVLVFCKTKHGSNRLASQLQRDGINADAIHGNKSQNARIRALEDFKEGKVKVLVATDIAARGLDIEELPHVVNFDLPHVPEGLRASHRPHRPRGIHGRGPVAGVRRGPAAPRRDRAAHQQEDRGAPVAGFEAGTPRAAATRRRRAGPSASRRASAAPGANASRKASARPRANASRRASASRRPIASPRAIAARTQSAGRARTAAAMPAWISASRTSPRRPP
jgi:superfamily II DNA/RNA helicase